MSVFSYNGCMAPHKAKPDTAADKLEPADLKRAVEELAAPPELIERRKTVRPIPIGEVSESSDPDAWELFAGTTQSMFVKQDPSS